MMSRHDWMKSESHMYDMGSIYTCSKHEVKTHFVYIFSESSIRHEKMPVKISIFNLRELTSSFLDRYT